MGIFNFLTGGLLGGLLGKKKTKKLTQQEILMNTFRPYYEALANMGGENLAQSKADYAKAGAGYDEALDYYRKVLSGDRSNLLDVVDASSVTEALDEQERQNYELAPRGGRRAATAANTGFSKFSQLNKILQAIRGEAPGAIANISNAIANMALGKANTTLGAYGTVLNSVTGISRDEMERQEREKDRRSALIGSIFSAAGSALGLIVGCNTLDTWIKTPSGYKQLKELHVGDKISIPTGIDGEFSEGKIIRKDILKNQNIYKLLTDNGFLQGSASHVLIGFEDKEIDFKVIKDELEELPFYSDGQVIGSKVLELRNTTEVADVAILKINDEKNNYHYITNGFISVDADCKR